LKRILFLVSLFVLLFTFKVYALTDDETTYKIRIETTVIEKDTSFVRDIPLSEELQEYAFDLCSQFGFDYELFLALMWIETGGTYKTNLVSKSEAIGICQLRKKYKESFCEIAGLDPVKVSLYDPEDSMYLSIALLNSIKQSCYRSFHDEDLTHVMLGIYNRGASGMKKYTDRYNTIETEYSNAIIERAKKLRTKEN